MIIYEELYPLQNSCCLSIYIKLIFLPHCFRYVENSRCAVAYSNKIRYNSKSRVKIDGISTQTHIPVPFILRHPVSLQTKEAFTKIDFP